MSAGRALVVVVALLPVPGGCAGARRLDTAGVAQLPRLAEDDPRLDAVVALRREGICSGTLVRERWVLTAAHCVTGLRAPPIVRVSLDGEEAGAQDLAVDRCVLHPRALPGATGCYAGRDDPPEDSYDLALLHLAGEARGVSPLDVMLQLPAGVPSVRDVAGWPVHLAGWRRVDAAVSVRHHGDSVVTDTGDLLFMTNAPADGRRGFATRPGDSGGPCLVLLQGRLLVAGVLTGGENPLSTDSIFVATAARVHAQWIRSVLSGD